MNIERHWEEEYIMIHHTVAQERIYSTDKSHGDQNNREKKQDKWAIQYIPLNGELPRIHTKM